MAQLCAYMMVSPPHCGYHHTYAQIALGRNCVAYGPGIQPAGVVVPSVASFVIEARDTQGNRVAHGGDTFVVGVASGPANVAFQIIDNTDGTYTVSYTPAIDGDYSISIKLDDIAPIAGSPFSVRISGMPRNQCTGTAKSNSLPLFFWYLCFVF